MEHVIAWCGFVGAWLLVAGPVFQAATELEDADSAREALAAAGDRVGPRPRLSAWWWLVPPLAYVVQRRRITAYRREVFHALTTAEVEQFLTFSAVASGWVAVAGGAFFIAVKETWELRELYEWSWVVFVALVVAMVVLAAGNTVVRVRRAYLMVEEARRRDTPTPTNASTPPA